MKNTIIVDVTLDDNKVPEKIEWSSSNNQSNIEMKNTKAMFMSFWDSEDKTALRLDLWTKTMRVDEMGDFMFQTLMTMADTLKKSHTNTKLDKELKTFATTFYHKLLDELKA